jgi:hypothetical protein
MMVLGQTIQVALTNMSNLNVQIKQEGDPFILDP